MNTGLFAINQDGYMYLTVANVLDYETTGMLTFQVSPTFCIAFTFALYEELTWYVNNPDP